MSKRLKFIFGGAGIALAVVYLITTGMSETAAYYLTVAEAANAGGNSENDTVRVKGKVRAGSINWDANELQLSFTLGDEHSHIAVMYHGIVPDLFAPGREVIVEGRLSPDGIVATSLLASCPSKYEAQDVAADLPP